MSELTDAKEALKAAEFALQDALEQRTLMEKQHYQNRAEVVHDIKNPLSAMMACFARLRRKAGEAQSVEISISRLGSLETTAHRILDICNSLLNEYGDHGSENEPETPVKVSELVNEVHDLFAAQAKERGSNLMLRSATPVLISKLTA